MPRGHLVREQGRTQLKYLPPPLVTLAVVASGLIGLGRVSGVLRGPAGRVSGLIQVVPLAYAGGLAVVSARSLGAASMREWLLNIAVLGIMHLSWGAGFLRGLVAGAEATVDTSRVTGR